MEVVELGAYRMYVPELAMLALGYCSGEGSFR